ncbi:MAG: hypothetical protein ACLPGW_07465 [Roseiarcus sp.]
MVLASVALALIVLALAMFAPVAWHWRVGISLAGLLVVWIAYPGVRGVVRVRRDG